MRWDGLRLMVGRDGVHRHMLGTVTSTCYHSGLARAFRDQAWIAPKEDVKDLLPVICRRLAYH